MKSILTSKRLAQFFALMLAIVMCLSACGGNGDTPSDTASADEKVSDTSVEQTNDEQEASSEKEATDDASSKKENTSNKQTANDSSSKNQTANKSSKVQQTNTQNAGSTTWAEDYLSTMPESVKSKGVTVLMWRDMHKTEKKVLDDFVKKTGCKVKVVTTTESEYATKLISMISSNESPDVCSLNVSNFPGIVTKSLQPLDEKVFRLDDDCWKKEYMDAMAINGQYYAVAMPKTWSCEDTTYITYYLPKVLKDAGVTTMPWQLYKQGKWNWEAQKEIVQKVAHLGSGFYGLATQNSDIYMYSAGADFVSYDGKQFKNNIGTLSGNSTICKAWQELTSLHENKAVTGWSPTLVAQGKVGLFSAIAYGAYNEGDWGFENIPGGFDAIECVPVAGPTSSNRYTPVRPKTWGTPKGAKNAEGAAYFLRYWLDVDNCDYESTVINDQVADVMDIVTSSKTKTKIMYSEGIATYIKADAYNNICWELSNSTSANILKTINSYSGHFDTCIKKANRDVERIIKKQGK